MALADDAVRAHQRGDRAAALGAIRSLLASDPLNPDLLTSLASELCASGDLAGAREHATVALDVQPDHPHALMVLGLARFRDGDFREALDLFDRADTVRPDLPVCRWNRAQCRLAFGMWRGGWEDYEWGKIAGVRNAARSLAPAWDGSRIPGRTLLVYPEQGLGDIVQFSRFLPLAKKRSGARVIVETRLELYRLLAANRDTLGFDALYVAPEDRSLPHAHDFQVSIASLPHVLGEECGDPGPYLSVDPGDGGPVGTVFCPFGQRSHPNDASRSLPRDVAESVLAALERPVLVGREPVGDTRPADTFDFLDLARLLLRSDGYYGVDTGIALLAGALGVPGMVFIPTNGEWRWGVDGPRSPWYSSLEVVRPTAGFPEALEV